jgi:hypothetical protein
MHEGRRHGYDEYYQSRDNRTAESVSLHLLEHRGCESHHCPSMKEDEVVWTRCNMSMTGTARCMPCTMKQRNKVKLALSTLWKHTGGIAGIDRLVLNRRTSWRLLGNVTPWSFYLRHRSASGSVWMLFQNYPDRSLVAVPTTVSRVPGTWRYVWKKTRNKRTKEEKRKRKSKYEWERGR